MTRNLSKPASVRTTVVIGLAALVTAGTVGAAAAVPAAPHPMLDTTCSLEQIESAATERAPELAARMAQHPEHRAKLAELLSMSPQERRGVIGQRQGEHSGGHPGEHAGHPGGHDGAHAKMLEVLEVCGSY